MSLTTTQLQALKADITTQVAGGSGTAIEGLDPNNPDDAIEIAKWYNEDSTFYVWETSVPAAEVGHNINLSNLGNLTTANSNRLQVLFQIVNSNSGEFPCSRADCRAVFEDIFSGATGAETRPQLLALWQRFATRCEALFTTGTGTQCTALNSDGTPSTGSPGSLVFEGDLDSFDVLNSNNV